MKNNRRCRIRARVALSCMAGLVWLPGWAGASGKGDTVQGVRDTSVKQMPVAVQPADAQSEAVGPALPRGAAAELMRLQEDTVVLKAQLKKLDAQAQVAERERALDRLSGGPSYDDVRVLATQSLGTATSATLSLSDGTEVEARSGDTLPNGMRVVAIRAGLVTVERHGGKRMVLPVWSARGVSRMAAQQGVPSMSMVPPIPTLPGLSR